MTLFFVPIPSILLLVWLKPAPPLSRLRVVLSCRLWRGAAASICAGQRLQSLDRHAAELKQRQEVHTELQAWVNHVLSVQHQQQQEEDVVLDPLQDAAAADNDDEPGSLQSVWKRGEHPQQQEQEQVQQEAGQQRPRRSSHHHRHSTRQHHHHRHHRRGDEPADPAQVPSSAAASSAVSEAVVLHAHVDPTAVLGANQDGSPVSPLPPVAPAQVVFEVRVHAA